MERHLTLCSNIDTQGRYEHCNTRSHFITPLKTPIELTERDVVWLKQISIPNSINNIVESMGGFTVWTFKEGTDEEAIKTVLDLKTAVLVLLQLYLDDKDFKQVGDLTRTENYDKVLHLLLNSSYFNPPQREKRERRAAKYENFLTGFNSLKRDIKRYTQEIRINLSPGKYTPESFMKVFNAINKSNKTGVSIKPDGERLVFRSRGCAKLTIDSPRLAYMLGMNVNENARGPLTILPGTTNDGQDFYLESLPHFDNEYEQAVLYSNIAGASTLGAGDHKYLRIINLFAGKRGEENPMITHDYANPHYITCPHIKTSEIEMSLCTMSGDPLPITRGNTTIVIGIKRIE